MVEDHIDNLLSKNSVQIKLARSPWGPRLDRGLLKKTGKSTACDSH